MILNFITAAILLTSTGLPELSELQEIPEEKVIILKDMKVSYGTFKDKIMVQWNYEDKKTASKEDDDEKEEIKTSYRLFRSNFKDKDFIEIAITDDTEYEDKEINPGIKYWYKVSLLNPEKEEKKSIFKSIASAFSKSSQFISEDDYNSAMEPDADIIHETAAIDGSNNNKNISEETDAPVIVSETGRSSNYSGFAYPEQPKGENLNNLIAMKKETLKNPPAKDQKDIQNQRLNYLKQFYMNQVKFSLVMLMAKPYIDNGDLLIFTDLNNYKINEKEKQIVFYNESYNYSITFESGKLIRILSEFNDQELKEILLRNVELFCIPSGKKEYKGEDNITRVIYTYDAVGLSTRYLKNDSQWRSRTIMLATSRSDLKKQLLEASQPLGDF